MGQSSQESAEDLKFLADLTVSGHIHPVIDKTYPLTEIVAAHKYVDMGHKKGNVCIEVLAQP